MTESLFQTVSRVIESKPNREVETASAWKEGYHKGKADEKERILQCFSAICKGAPAMQTFIDQIKNQIFSEGEI